MSAKVEKNSGYDLLSRYILGRFICIHELFFTKPLCPVVYLQVCMCWREQNWDRGGSGYKKWKVCSIWLAKNFFFVLYILLMSCFFQKYLHLDSFLKMSDSAGLKIHYTVCTYNFAFCLQLLFLYLVFGIGQHVKTQIFVLSTLEFTQILMS